MKHDKYPMKCRCGNEYAIELPEGQPFKTDDEDNAFTACRNGKGIGKGT